MLFSDYCLAVSQRLILLVIAFYSVLFAQPLWAQRQPDGAIAHQKAKKAIELMDAGEYDRSIEILKECERLDPDNYVYPYEIAYAYTLQQKHKQALKVIKKVVRYPDISSQVYQMLGNSYSYLGKPQQAIKAYEAGLERFPNAGNLYLERGTVYRVQEKWQESMASYAMGIEVDPDFASNYYWLSLLYMSSNNRFAGLILGEAFMNLERTTPRTQQISKSMLQTYKDILVLEGDSAKFNFCQVVFTITVDQLKDGELDPELLKRPLCDRYGEGVAIQAVLGGYKEVNLATLHDLRLAGLQYYLDNLQEEHPNAMLDYQAKILEAGHFEAYNYYLLQIEATREFQEWKSEHESEYNDFVRWYTQSKNELEIESYHDLVE